MSAFRIQRQITVFSEIGVATYETFETHVLAQAWSAKGMSHRPVDSISDSDVSTVSREY